MLTMAHGAPTTSAHSLSVAGLFAGIGGIETGLHLAGHTSRLLCEVAPGACRVLEVGIIDAVASHVEGMHRSAA